MTTRLLLVRHGQTDWNVEGRYQGQKDPPLNPQGRDQAIFLAEDLSAVPLHVLYSSPLQRAWETAHIIEEKLALPLYVEPRLMEISMGEWEGRLVTEIAVRDSEQFLRWESSPWSVAPPGGESLYHVRERVYAAVDEIVPRHVGRSIGLVTHQLPLALLKIRYQKLNPSLVRKLDQPNASWEEVVLDSRAGTGWHS